MALKPRRAALRTARGSRPRGRDRQVINLEPATRPRRLSVFLARALRADAVVQQEDLVVRAASRRTTPVGLLRAGTGRHGVARGTATLTLLPRVVAVRAGLAVLIAELPHRRDRRPVSQKAPERKHDGRRLAVDANPRVGTFRRNDGVVRRTTPLVPWTESRSSNRTRRTTAGCDPMRSDDRFDCCPLRRRRGRLSPGARRRRAACRSPSAPSRW